MDIDLVFHTGWDCHVCSGIVRTFPGGRFARPEDQNEEENEKSLRKNKKYRSKFEDRMRKVEVWPTRDCEATALHVWSNF